ncbi:benzoate/H(+) symporter BenE family transporter [Streptomyces sp. P9(2023)]|uniref:benzoate/H(+) symporter BenE family transporter n=1 Tax=Streptomyces sp. P9(2023) TaxID=3064394 RepID=UPI0028F4348B|nr:benzoate/H(+) symporter BenE family transporter [Streptomyces sp. P9(2023)]MDT9690149.1 benzoate/H(+) symporter BenE family transporter [Streptomyces sp. P9(2023)]
MAFIRHVRSAAPATAVSAGFLAVLIGVTSSVAVVFTAAKAAGATSAELTSWVFALGIGMGVTCIGLSLRYRAPVVTAWSTPGAALLATGLQGVTMAQAVGAFLLSAVLIVISGVTGWFERIMNRIPVPLASALLAGVLLQFGTELFTQMERNGVVAVPMFLAYLAGRRWFPRYAVVAALAVGVAATAWQGSWKLDGFELTLAQPSFVRPEFDWQVLVGVGLPLFAVTMASQNLPGIAVLRNAGYSTPVSPLLTWTGTVNAVLAPFGCFGLNLAAITAAICSGEAAHPDPRKRWVAGVWTGVFYLLVGLFGGTVGWLLTAMPPALVLGIAGIGLLGTIGSSLTSALRDDRLREPAVVTLLATASGFTLFGIGSTFWGLLAGVLTLAVGDLARRGRGTGSGSGSGSGSDEQARSAAPTPSAAPTRSAAPKAEKAATSR